MLCKAISILCAPLLLSVAFEFSTAHAASPPNVIIILVDDMGFSDVGCYGGEIETPNIDSLAAQGLRFTQFYNAGRCCPTRASLMTGLHPHQVGIGHMTEPPEQPLEFPGAYQGHLNDECITLAQTLRAVGYHTLMVGKWHLGYHQQSDWPLQRGFDQYFGSISGAFNYFKPTGTRGLMDGNLPIDAPEEFYATDTFTDVACDYIRESDRKDDRPFFLYLAYNAPHWPLNAKLEDFQKYRGKYSDGWQALMANRIAKQKSIGLFEDTLVPAPHVGPDWNSLGEKQRDDLDAIMAAYAGCVDSIDQNVGRLVDCLHDLDQFDNTLILFLSDNGACQEGGILGKGSEAMVRNPPAGTEGVRQGLAWANASNTPFRLYKHFVHEGGACTPLVTSWPAGIPRQDQGGFVRQVAYLPDVMATLVDLTNTSLPDGLPQCVGQSMTPILRGSREPIHSEPIFWEHEGNAAMRWDDWKLVREYRKPWELYDLASDRTELNDLADSNPAQLKTMIQRWEKWATTHQVAFPERFNMYEFLKKKRQQKNANPKK